MKYFDLKIKNDAEAPVGGFIAEFLHTLKVRFVMLEPTQAEREYIALEMAHELVKQYYKAAVAELKKGGEFILTDFDTALKIGKSGSHIWIHDNRVGCRIAMIWMKEAEPIYCENCEKKLDPIKAVWLELSNTDGMYYTEIPKGHESQGCFTFGSACAKKELKKLKAKSTKKTSQHYGDDVDAMGNNYSDADSGL